MTRYALVIGIDNYTGITNLRQAANDAEKIGQLLKQQGRFDVKPLPGNFIKSENCWQVASNKRLTGKELGKELRIFLLEKAKEGEALIYFAGHGFEALSLTGEPKGYFATSDCNKDGQNAIAFDDFNTLISKSNLSSLVVLLDCCHAGSLLEKSFINSNFTIFNSKKNYCLITACLAGEKAIEDEEKGGIFTQAVLKGLASSQADETTGEINVNDLMGFISRELKGSGQEPIYMGGGRSIPLVWYPRQNSIATGVVSEECPYRGLEAFDKQHAKFFFGSQKVVNSIQQKLYTAKFVPIIGASGSGKSSVVRAGLIPQLNDSEWQVLEPIKPGFEPLDELRTAFKQCFKQAKQERVFQTLSNDYPNNLPNIIAILPGTTNFLLVVDQFEEVFTVCANKKERERFIELLTQVVKITDSRLAVMITMRADFLEPCLQYPSLIELIQTQAVLMPPLTGNDLKEAIIEPAKLQGHNVEDALLIEILVDVGKEPGFLPLLEFTLTKLWEKRDQDKHLLTLKQYQKLGGITGALNLHAQRVYHYQDYQQEFPTEERSQQEKDWIRLIFLRLVRTGEGEKDTRQRRAKAALLKIANNNFNQQQQLSELLEGETGLVNGRLLVAGKDEQGEAWIDLAHEALIESWQTFREWRQEDRDLRRLSDKLADNRREWCNKGENYFIQGGLLAEVRDNWQQLQLYLQSPLEDEVFYRRSDAYEKDRIAELEKALDNVEKQRGEAEKNEITALCKSADVLFTSGQKFDALFESFRAARKLQQISSTEFGTLIDLQVRTTLAQAVYGVIERNRLEDHSAIVWSVTFSPDGKTLASASADTTIKLWSINGDLLKTFRGHDLDVYSISFSPDGKFLVSGSKDKTVKLWNINGELLQTFQEHTNEVWSVNFSPDGKTFVSGSADSTIKLWNIDGHLLRTFQGHTGQVTTVKFNPDGKTLASSSQVGTIKLWGFDGQELKTIEDNGYIISLDFSPDGKTLASANWDKIIKLWSLDGQLLETFHAHDSGINNIIFSPDGKILASAGADNSIKLWRLDGQLLQTFKSSNNCWVRHVSFSPDGKMLASAGDDHRISIWCLDKKLLKILQGHSEEIWSISFSPKGRTLASCSDETTVKLWNTDGHLLNSFEAHDDGVWNVSFSPDGETLASCSADTSIKLWSFEGELLRTFQGHNAEVWGISFNPDGKILASASYDKTVKLWSIEGELLYSLQAHDAAVNDVSFSPDGKTLASASSDKTIKLWNLEGQLLHTLQAHDAGVLCIIFSPDGKTLASASYDRTIKLWDLKGQLLHTLQAHGASVNSLCFSSDGQTLASASSDKTIKLWSIEGELLHSLQAHDAGVNDISFSPDDKTLISANGNTIFLWDLEHLSIDALMQCGCDWVLDYLKTNPNVEDIDRHLCNILDKI